MLQMKVKQMQSLKSYASVANQLVINTPEGQYFQSYDSIIVFRPFNSGENNKVILDEQYWDYSRTTSKYRNAFMNEDTKETKRKIKEGVYILGNLNA